MKVYDKEKGGGKGEKRGAGRGNGEGDARDLEKSKGGTR